MSNRRLGMHRLQELVRLHRMGTGSREASRLLGMGRNTQRQYRQALAAEGLLDGAPEPLPELSELRAAVLKHHPPADKPPQETSRLGAFRDVVKRLLDQGLGPRGIYDRLRLEHGDLGASLSAVKRLCRALERERGVRPSDVAIAVETGAGEVAQVDFGYVGQLFDPHTHTLRRAWCFVMVLGYSRHMVVRVVFDQKTETWLRLHIEAFEELGGVPETVVPDNLKAAVVRAAFSVDDATELNRSYRELARHYGFRVDPTPPYDAAKKGKVEAGVKYVKGNFFAARERSDITEVRRELGRWVTEIAGQRVHGTTGRRPLEVFEDIERAALRPLPAQRFEPVLWKKATVHRDTHIAFERRLYSVPWKLIGKQVWVRATATSLVVYADDERVATHSRRGTGYRSTAEAHLPEHRGDLRHRSRAYWVERAGQMGPTVAAYVQEIFDSDDVLSQLRTVQAVVTHLETFPVERAVAACERARHFGNYGYQAIKTILRRALDLEPAAVASAPAVAAPPEARFARSPSAWMHRFSEVNHESCG